MVWVSIVTPVYNGIEFLEECINSVISQTFQDWEMLIGINGHGEDGGECAVLAKEWAKKDKRITVFVQPPPIHNKVSSLHDLVRLSQADWISVLDCDDVWKPTKLQEQYHALHSYASQASVIGTFCQYIGDYHYIPPLPSGYISPEELEIHNPIINSSVLLRKELSHWNYNEQLIGIEDYYLWMTIILAGHKLYNIPQVLVYHRIHQQSAFNSKHISDQSIKDEYKQKRQHIPK